MGALTSIPICKIQREAELRRPICRLPRPTPDAYACTTDFKAANHARRQVADEHGWFLTALMALLIRLLSSLSGLLTETERVPSLKRSHVLSFVRMLFCIAPLSHRETVNLRCSNTSMTTQSHRIMYPVTSSLSQGHNPAFGLPFRQIRSLLSGLHSHPRLSLLCFYSVCSNISSVNPFRMQALRNTVIAIHLRPP